MKLCPQCEKENPSSANHCMYCGTLLIAEEELSAEIKLQKELNDAKDTIQLLKQSLLAAHEQTKINPVEANKTIQLLENQIIAQQEIISDDDGWLAKKESETIIALQPLEEDSVPEESHYNIIISACDRAKELTIITKYEYNQIKSICDEAWKFDKMLTFNFYNMLYDLYLEDKIDWFNEYIEDRKKEINTIEEDYTKESKDIVLPKTVKPKTFQEKIVYIQPEKKSSGVAWGVARGCLIVIVLIIIISSIIIASL
jgi:hypothetical protein